MKVAVLGAGRNRNGIGRYIARFFHQNDTDIVAVLGTTPGSSRKAAHELERFGISASAYTCFDEMIASEKPDAVAIASPPETHRAYVERSIAAGLHVFCEKPFMWPLDRSVIVDVHDLLARAEAAALTVCMNSQWPFSLPWYEKVCGSLQPGSPQSFFISMQPPGTGLDMVPDAAPHMLSMLYCVLGPGEIANCDIAPGKNSMSVRFSYLSDGKECRVVFELIHNARQPRTFAFGFDGRRAERRIDPATYALSLVGGERQCRLHDPLDLSVRDFITAVRQRRQALIGAAHIIDTMKLLMELYDSCRQAWNRTHGKTAEQGT